MSDNIQFLPVEDLQPVFVFSALSEVSDWGLETAGIPAAHLHTKGEGVVVGVMDTGGPSHPDLNQNLLPAINCSRSGNASDSNGHATHCCGIIAALANGFGVIGVAPEAKILPIKVLDDHGQGGYREIEAGIRKAMEMKVDILNMSLGSPIVPPASLYDTIKEAAAQGIIIVAAAGNDSGRVNYPARYDEVIAVAAIDGRGQLAEFTSRGEEIDVSAPGVDTYSTYINNLYAQMSGTSQAAPFIAGVCALILAWARKKNRTINGVVDMLQHLDDMCDPQGRVGTAGREGSVGFGVPSFLNHMPWRGVE